MASTAWMKNKDDRAMALAEYRRLRALTAREVAEVMQPMLGSDNAALKSAAHRLYNGVTPREGYEEGENHEAENTLILDYALLLNDRFGPSPRRQYIDKYADSEEKAREYTRKITAASKHLLGLINDVLDMSKIESGKATLNITEFRLSALIDEINSVLAPQAEARKQKFSVKCYGIEHDTLLGDRLHISQIIINLLSNSIKYTPEGGQIELTVCGLNTVSENYEHLRFEVKDTGIGMSEEFLKTIFEPFTREANSTTSGIRGTGLGMAITKNLVDLMGGAISVDSHPGKGSTFTVELELRISEHCVEEGQRITARKRREEKENNILSTDAVGKNELAGMNFLIAEDNAMNAEILSELIRLEGGISTIAHNGKEALEIFRNSSEKYFDVILMDIQMPVMNGYEATRAIRDCGKPEAKTIPILAMTANAFVEDVQNALAAGMNAHISKPVDLGMLKETVKKMIA